MAGFRLPRRGRKSTGRSYSSTHVNRSRKKRGSAIRRVLFSLLVLAAVAVAVSFLVLRSSNGISVFENVVGTVFRPIESAFSSAAGGVKNFFSNWRNYDKLQREYETLEMTNEELSLKLSGVEETEQENARLKVLLDAQDAYEALDPIYAKVIARDPGQWFDTFTINRGTAHGVTEGMSVVTGAGLVGYVYEAGLTYAKVLTIIDTRSAVAVLVQRTRDNGVMRGEVTEASDSAECYTYYLPNVNNIMPGDVIVTSGTDSLYPKGLTIGEVIAVSQETSSDGSYVIVSPYVDFRHVEEVLVLRTVVETQESLPVVATPTPAPEVTPRPSASVLPDGSTVEPDATDDGNWSYPTIEPTEPPVTPEPTMLELLPEDQWADS
ncbi:MAG: rod shape-determining protein MreC [Eubacteriales bacterium]|nr:rod shape-determining protein MreC [Eubacteriales bacterium]